MIHISEMDIQRTNQISDITKVGESIEALIKTIDREGKIGLSRKALLIKNKK